MGQGVGGVRWSRSQGSCSELATDRSHPINVTLSIKGQVC